MPKYNRIFTIVIDSLGTGAMPDSEKFGDVGVDTLGHIAEHMKGFHIPNLQKLGIANLRPLKGVAPVEKPTGRFTKFSEASNGKDTMTGHWEMMGIYTTKPFKTFTDHGFPGHADYTFEEKYGFRDYRGGGRSSARETIGRVAAGAIAEKFLKQLNISVTAYAKSIGPVEVSPERMDLAEIQNNRFCLPDAEAAKAAEDYLDQKIAECDSVGGVVECVISGLPVGLGEPVFEKLDANLAKAILSIGAVKGFEIGDGFAATKACGSENNDEFRMDGDKIVKETNHAGGVLGGISDGSDVVFRAAFKPTPSIAKSQETVTKDGANIDLVIHGRHDPVVVPRAVVVVESMAAITAMDMLLVSMTSRLDLIQIFFQVENADDGDN